jgi:hypothetical protein
MLLRPSLDSVLLRPSMGSMLLRLSLPGGPPQLIKILHSQGSIITWRAATLAGGDQDMRKAPLLTLLMMDLKEESHGDTMGGEPRWRWLPHIWPPGRCSTPFGSPPASYPATTPLLSPPPSSFFVGSNDFPSPLQVSIACSGTSWQRTGAWWTPPSLFHAQWCVGVQRCEVTIKAP